MVFKRLFGGKCEHDFHIVDEESKEYINYELKRYETMEYYILYCPKCDKQKKVNVKDYDRKLEKERIKREYNK